MRIFKRSNFFLLNWVVETLNKEKEIDFAVGGQAVIEGVMMRSPNSISIAVRKAGGEIKVKNKNYRTLTQRYRILNIPILRGFINLIEMMVVGTQAINFSANEQLDDIKEEEGIKTESKFARGGEILLFVFSIVLALGFGILLFKFTPLLITTFVEGKSTFIAGNYFLFNLLDGAIKITIFITYIFLLGLLPEFKRVFQYHGAEHKSIYAYEKKLPLNKKNASLQTRFHPRCGTSFILIVFATSIIVYSLVPRPPEFLANFGMRLSLLPLISGISYELLKISAKRLNNFFVRTIVAPGLLFQKLTTKEPNGEQLEVGLKSLKDALVMEKAAN